LEACPELGTPATPARPRNIGRLDAAFRLVDSVGVATSRISELNLRGLLPCCVCFAPTSHPVSGNTRYRPARSLWPCGTCTRWTPSRGFTVSSSVPPLPRFSQRDNNVGPGKHFLSRPLSFYLKEFFSFVFFLVLSSLHRRPRLVCNLSSGFSPLEGYCRDERCLILICVGEPSANNSEVFIGASRRNGKNQQTVDARFRNKRSKLHGPPPVHAPATRDQFL